jgi:predicted enzyme related to lactoylglutathione lyase
MADAVLNLVVIRAIDLDRADRFYSALGIRLGRERHGTGPEHLAGQVGTAVLEIYPLRESGRTNEARLGFRVSSIADALAAAQAAGGSVVTPPRASAWGLRAVLIDPDGHHVELLE